MLILLILLLLDHGAVLSFVLVVGCSNGYDCSSGFSGIYDESCHEQDGETGGKAPHHKSRKTERNEKLVSHVRNWCQYFFLRTLCMSVFSGSQTKSTKRVSGYKEKKRNIMSTHGRKHRHPHSDAKARKHQLEASDQHTDFWVVYTNRYLGCGTELIEYLTDYNPHARSPDTDAMRIPNTMGYTAETDSQGSRTLLVGVLRDASCKEELRHLIGPGRLLDIPVRNVSSDDEAKQCADHVIWLTDHQEGPEICRYFRERYGSQNSLGKVIVLSVPLNTPAASKHISGFLNHPAVCRDGTSSHFRCIVL